MATKAVNATQLDGDLTSVANAIRTKGGTSAALSFPAGFVSAVQNIPSGGGALSLIASGSAAPSSRTLTITGVTKAPKVIELYFEGTATSVPNTKPLMALIVCNGNTVTALYALTVSISITDRATVTTDTSAFSVALNGTTLTITCNTSGWFSANYKYALWS